MQGPDLGIGLQRGERTKRKRQVRLTGLDVGEAVAARQAALGGDAMLGFLAVGIRAALSQALDDCGVEGNEPDGHDGILWAAVGKPVSP